VPEILDRRFKGTHLPTPTNDRFPWTTSTGRPFAFSVLLLRPRLSSWFSFFYISTYLKLVKPALNRFCQQENFFHMHGRSCAALLPWIFFQPTAALRIICESVLRLCTEYAHKICECVYKESLGDDERVTANPISISLFSYKSF